MILLTRSTVADMDMMRTHEFTMGIHETEEHKIADSNEIYDFLIPVNIGAYKEARQEIGDLKNKYEQARMRFHKKKLDPSTTLRRSTELLDISIADLDKVRRTAFPRWHSTDH